MNTREALAPDGPLAEHEYEHIFADNVSQDGTVDILRRLAASDSGLKVILNAPQFRAVLLQL